MITKTANFFRGKAVLVKVYEEKPRKNYNLLSSKGTHDHHQHVHHHYHHHLCVHHDVTVHKDCCGDATDAAGKGHNRRAQLLLHSQGLRARPAQQTKTSFFQPTQPSPSNNSRLPTNKIVPNQGKPKRSRIPRPGNWKALLSNSWQSLNVVQVKKSRKQKNHNAGSTSHPILAAMKTMKVQKKEKGLFSKLVPHY